MDKYGHLQPGTYDINSERYDQLIKKFFLLRILLNQKTKNKLNYQIFKKIRLEKCFYKKLILMLKIYFHIYHHQQLIGV